MGVSISSDYDYLKYDEGTLLMTTGDSDSDFAFPDQIAPGSELAVETVAHDFGIVPLVRSFYDPAKNGRWYQTRAYPSGNIDYPYLSVIATTTNVKFGLQADTTETNIPVYYRVYDIGDKSITSAELIDKIFFKSEELSQSVPAASGAFTPGQSTITIPHGIGEVPLWTLQHSENGDDWFPEGVRNVGGPDTTSGPPGGPYSRSIESLAYASADSTNLYIVLQNYEFYSAKTIHYRYTLDYKI